MLALARKNCFHGVVVGYWPSYNIPFYPHITNVSGYAEYEHIESMTDYFNYQVSARAKIFRRDQGNIVDMQSMQNFMRSNGMYLRQVLFSYIIPRLHDRANIEQI